MGRILDLSPYHTERMGKFLSKTLRSHYIENSFCRHEPFFGPSLGEIWAEYFNRKLGLRSINWHTKDMSTEELLKSMVTKKP